MSIKIREIYDRIFKKILTLSNKSVINLINGLFDTDYPLDSVITYHWTEMVDDDLRKTLADTIITVNGCDSYHIEAQMYTDDDIVMRVFNYSYGHSVQYRKYEEELVFPVPKIIYFGDAKNVPDTYKLVLNFKEQGKFEYKVKTFKYQEHSIEEINNMKLIILIPFELLKLRELLKKERTEENLNALKNLVRKDIIGSIQKNYEVGNITGSDVGRLMQLTKKLYNHLYSEYEQLEVIEEMDESLILEYEDLDRKYAEIDRRQMENEKKLTMLGNIEEKYKAAKESLEQTKTEYEQTKTEYEQTKLEYKQTKTEYEQTKTEYEQTKTEYARLTKENEEKDKLIKKLMEENAKLKVETDWI
ncbi:MAG: hypothetical protein E7270_09980 [Lachnospiraceae bacterium]|nr:hypothetical protein [Lachnospiraceae bacterium]